MDENKILAQLENAVRLAADKEKVSQLKAKFSGIYSALQIIEREVAALTHNDHPGVIAAESMLAMYRDGLLKRQSAVGDDQFVLEVLELMVPPNLLRNEKRQHMELHLMMIHQTGLHALKSTAGSRN